MSYDNTNSAALFPVEQKKSEKAADERGSMNLEGTELWLSAWLKEDKNGNTFRSLSAQPKNDPDHARRQFSGVLFEVREPSSEKAPTWEGHMELEMGLKIGLVGWNRVSQNGTPYMSIKLEEFKEREIKRKPLPGIKSLPGAPAAQQAQPAPQHPAELLNDFEDDLPF